MEFFELQSIDQFRRMGLAVTREVDVAPMESYRVALDGDDAVAGGEGQTNLASLAPPTASGASGATRWRSVARN
ncbi:hypothetical protein ACIQUZ_01385 [Streptomyces griseus]|uniref:hypothetical protein n=1 Tax=Streptomyces griseus TaxID=1911 RepID=UPI0037FF49EA